ncbi:MAG: UDP-N-acetylglucosamine 1-carboxyvinyltransferase [Clostridia bacterium]|nr:UDP-N-acetylglucosamine 1-carboxyvinyltransferase [Clostridia bacterium]
MDKFIIEGGNRLYGSINVQSAKNSVLVLLAASILTEEQVIIENVPKISDVIHMHDILRKIGAKVSFQGGNVYISSENAVEQDISSHLTRELRSSVFMLGSVLTRFKHARISYPGGCDIGLRPIDLHLFGLKKLGVKIEERDGYINCNAEKLQGGNIHLDFPSVGATENILLAAVQAQGETVITNAAKEPEIRDLQDFLNRMGAKVHGAGTDTVTVQGVKKLHGTRFTPLRDRIEAGTFLIAGAMCGGEMLVEGVKRQNIASLLNKLSENTCKIHIENDKIYLKSSGNLKCNRYIETLPFPGFPTDLQAQMTSLNSIADGACILTENLFETRFKNVPELIRMGADITVKNRTALVRGVKRLHGATVSAEDLRGGAALTLAALAAEGKSEVLNLSHIDRGYASLDKKLKALGAKIERVQA